MNTFDRRVYAKRRKYTHIKKYWKLLQKNQTKLNSQKRLWCPVFRAYLTETDIVDRLLSYDLKLHKGYTLYQHFLCAFKEKNFSHFHQLLLEDVSYLPENYQKTIQAFKKMSKKIK